MRNVLCSVIIIILASACSMKEADTGKGDILGSKRAALARLKNQQSDLANQIAVLEAEINHLDPSKAVKPKLVSVLEIAPVGFEAYINLYGRVSSENIAYVAPRNGMGGYVEKVFIKEGQAVRIGQLILKLDDKVLRQSIESVKTQLTFAQDVYDRTNALWKQKIGTEVQLLSAKNNVNALKDQLATLEEQLKTYLVYADQSGIAEIVNIRPGELFSGVGLMGPQIQIVNNSELTIKVDVPENYAGETKVGTQVLVEIPAVGKSFKTSINRLSQSVNASSVGFSAVCIIPSTAGLKPNMSASVKILRHSNSNALVVPVNVVQSDEIGKYVYLMVDEGSQKVARKINVTLGVLYGDQIEILQGLKPGDKLVTKGYQDLYEGQVLSNI